MNIFSILLRTCTALLLFPLLFSACDQEDDGEPTCTYTVDPGTRFFEFEHRSNGDRYYAWTADTAVISAVETQLALPEGERNQHINGPIARVPEGCELNRDWSWYFEANQWSLVEFSVEVCDGNPRYVEENIQTFIDIGSYCPWAASVKREIDRPF